MTKYTTINGVDFETIKPKSWSVEEAIHQFANESRYTLESYYETFSDAKRSIYEEWVAWSENAPIWHLSVTSANRKHFTITCILEDENGDNIGLIVITKSHNRLYLVN